MSFLSENIILILSQRFLLPKALTRPLFMLTSSLACIVPLASINLPSVLYIAATTLFFLSLIVMLTRSDSAPLTGVEKLMLACWVVYPTFTAIDLWFRTGWDWVLFQEPSRFLLVLPIFLMVRRVGLSKQAIMWGVLAGAIVAGSYGIYQKQVLGFGRAAGGTSGLIAAFGDISLILGVMCVALIQPYWRNSKGWLLIAFLGLSLGVVGSLMSGTKGGWISMPILCWLVVDLLEKPTYLKRFIVLISFVLLAVIVWYYVPFIEQRMSVIVPAIDEYFVNGKVADGSAGIRLALWHAATLIFIDNPLFGTGPGTYYIEKLEYINAGLIPSEAAGFTGPHSQLFESLFESGIFGPIMVYSIYFSFIWHCRKHFNQNKALSSAGVLMAAGFIDFGMVEVIWDINNAGVFYTVMMVLIAGKLSFDRQYVTAIT
jgi:O-antigen ligase